MKTDNRIIGAIGEDLAWKLLEKKGFELVKKNYSSRWGEIDLICRDGETLVFVEVKTKRGFGFGMPEEMVTRAKKAQVRRTAIMYMGGEELKCRLDVVAIVLDNNGRPIYQKHYQDLT
jgi:putative endonuclease